MDITSFANQHPFIFFLILITVVLPAIAIIVGITGDVLNNFFAIFKRNK